MAAKFPQTSAHMQGWLAAIIDSSDDAIVSKTLQGQVTTWNAAAERMFGYSAEEMVGQSITRIIPEDRMSEEAMILSRLAAGQRLEHFETVRRHKDGRLIDVSVTISPILDAEGNVAGISKIARDISARRAAQRELAVAREQEERARREAEAASAAKDHFLAVLSHELRTPLTAALAAIGLVEADAGLKPETREAAMMVRRNIESEARLADDLLDTTRVAYGKVHLRFELVDAGAVLRGVAAMVRSQAAAKRQQLRLDLPVAPVLIRADLGRFQQIVLNLVSNAIKFTGDGGWIQLRAAAAGESLVVEVADNGIGIEPEAGTRLFEAFEQGERTFPRRFGGLGLGLSIVQSLVLLHQGTISYASKGKGCGSVFTVTLPLASSAAAQQAQAAKPAERAPINADVLLVEDHDDSRTAMVHVLRRFGCRVVAAGSVAEAATAAAGKAFDLLVCDLGLPDGTGEDVLRALRSHQAGIRAIALTGFGQDEDRTRSQRAGFALHVTKPVDAETLRQAIAAACA